MNRKLIILIVDDEIQIINALKRVFYNSNYEILSSTTPEEAMIIMYNSKIDIVICDYNMPNINGIKVLKYAKKVIPDAIRILMTGCSDVNIAISAINEGSVFYYISKPWKNDEVISVIHDAIEKKRSRNGQKDLYRIINDSQNFLTEVSNKLNYIDKGDGTKNIRVSVIDNDNILLINSKDILYLTANEGDVFIFTNNGYYRSQESLNIWYKKLGERFFRCHRSYLINMDRIESLSPWFSGTYNVKLKSCKDNIPVSRGNVKTLKDLLGI